MYKLEYFVPLEHAEAVNRALFAAGAGRIGNYDSCCWMTDGQGQYRPLAGANPFQGSVGQIERAREAKVEMVVQDELRDGVKAALLDAHPYETPAYHFIKVED